MTRAVWNLFPFPTMTESDVSDGVLYEAHHDCITCPTKGCLDDTSSGTGEVAICRYGLSYARVDDSRVINGLVCTDTALTTKRAKRRARAEQDRHVRKQDLYVAADRARLLGPAVVDDYELAQATLLGELENNPRVYEAIARKLREDYADNLNQSHDFLQLVKLVRGHAEALLHERYPDLSPEDAANKLPTEGAIYYSTSLMLVKMDSMLYLNEINRALGGESRFQIHPFVLKYLRIYRWQADQKQLQIALVGSCYASSVYNNDAIGAVIQGLFDNMVKYAPANSQAAVIFTETDTAVDVTFESLGPKIESDELARIFLPQYRSKAARRIELSGLGVGLATAKGISDALDLELAVTQESNEDADFPERFKTRFSMRLNRTE